MSASLPKCANCNYEVPDKTGFGACFIYSVERPEEAQEYAVLCDSCGAGKTVEEMLAMIHGK